MNADELFATMLDDVTEAYRHAFGGGRDLVTVEPGDGHTYLFDATTDSPATEPAPRVVAGWGRSHPATMSRDRSFLCGFPLLAATLFAHGPATLGEDGAAPLAEDVPADRSPARRTGAR